VTLRGQVRSWAERDAAHGAARSACGVSIFDLEKRMRDLDRDAFPL
jgi:osmotically-inducible protein OsmY